MGRDDWIKTELIFLIKNRTFKCKKVNTFIIKNIRKNIRYDCKKIN